MNRHLEYGRNGSGMNLPEPIVPTIIRKPVMRVLHDIEQAVANALAEPIACRSLVNIARNAKSVAIAV